MSCRCGHDALIHERTTQSRSGDGACRDDFCDCLAYVRNTDPSPVESSGEFLARIGTDAEKWANEFLGRLTERHSVIESITSIGFAITDTSPGSDLHHMVQAWFANAIGAGQAEASGRAYNGYDAAQSEAAGLIKAANEAVAKLSEMAVGLFAYDEQRAGRLLDIATALRQATVVEQALHIIRRTDGGKVHHDGHAFMTCDGPDDWQVADDNEHHLYDEKVDYEILACRVVNTRTFGVTEVDEVEAVTS